MKPFLLQLIETVKSEHKDLGKVTLVVPTQRSGVYCRKYLSQLSTETTWAPKIITIDDFIKDNCRLKPIDSIELLFLFYEIYLENEKQNPDSFFYFTKWAPTLLADFNEMDHYMVDSKTIFNDLRNIKEIDNWSFNEEKLSDMQQDFVEFWATLPTLYKTLNDRLTAKNKGYSGKLYKWVATSIYEVLDDHEDNSVYFAGFNALSTSEELIIDTFVNSGKGQLFMDGDTFYIDNPDHEAGLFLRKQIASKGKKAVRWIDSHYIQGNKNIELLSAQSSVMMAKAVGDHLSKLSESEIKKTAVVLADESLLLPIMNSIPESIDSYNISLGYSLFNSPVFSLLSSLFLIQESYIKHNKGSLHYRSFLGLAEHYLMKKVIQSYSIKQEIVAKNITFISSKYIKEKEELEGLEFLFNQWDSENIVQSAFDALNKLIEKVVESLDFGTNSLELEYLFSAQKVLHKVENKLTHKNYIEDLKTLKQLFFQLFKSENVSFIGEPLSGLQLIGMLETRALDFENIILVSVNEEVLPKGKSSNSFFPYELKKLYGLPTYKEKEAIYAHHFYRLLQRASNVSLVYNSSLSGMNGSEKSRYIEQLKEELSGFNNITITEKVIATEINKSLENGTVITKNKAIIDKLMSLAEYGFSPSAISKYLSCPLDFYYSYVVGLRDEEEVEEDIEANTFGNIIHKVLEHMYKPYIDKNVAAHDIQEMKKQVDELLNKYFKEEYSSHFDTGKNYLMYHGAKKSILSFLSKEETLVKENELIIIGLEKDAEREFEFETAEGLIKTRLRGKIDRIDQLNGELRIIDYKTGAVKPEDVRATSISSLFANKSFKGKVFQLLVYDFLMETESKTINNSTSGIISTKAISSGLMGLEINRMKPTDEVREEFKIEVARILTEIFDLDVPFEHNENALYCNYCD
ncbi:MAG: PD-(D/E)XK nuclease family protein [Flavobacteriales bacterium]